MRLEEAVAHYIGGPRGSSLAAVQPPAPPIEPEPINTGKYAIADKNESVVITSDPQALKKYHGSESKPRANPFGRTSKYQDHFRSLNSHRLRLLQARFPRRKTPLLLLRKPRPTFTSPRAMLPHLGYSPIRQGPRTDITLPHLVHPSLIPELLEADASRASIRGCPSPKELHHDAETPDQTTFDETKIGSTRTSAGQELETSSHLKSLRGSEVTPATTEHVEDSVVESEPEEEGWSFCDGSEFIDKVADSVN